MKKWVVALGAVAGVAAGAGVFFTNQIMYIKKKQDEEIITRETSEGLFDMDAYEQLEKQTFTVPSPFGYKLNGTLIAPYEHKNYIIFCHGVTVNSYNSIKYMNLFIERGWNVILYDHRRHGLSEGKTTSYGHYEKFDLQAIVHWAKLTLGTDITLGIHGESMGAVTTLLYAGMVEDGASFYILDCPFSSFEEQLTYRLKEEFRLPSKYILPLANVFLKVRDGYSLKDVSPINAVQNIQKPALFIHSEEDDYILPYMTKALYAKKQGPKKLYMAPKGTHARSYADNGSHYKQIIDEFLAEYELAPQV